jgi:LysR family transcriptional regulator for metE and metH
VRELIDGRRQPVRVTTQCATTYQWLPEALRALREREPGAEVRIEAAPDHEMISALLDDRSDVALINKLDRPADRVRLQRLFDDELRAVVASSASPPDGRHAPAIGDLSEPCKEHAKRVPSQCRADHAFKKRTA